MPRRRSAAAPAPTEEARAAVVEAVEEVAMQPFSPHPIALKPALAPEGALDESLPAGEMAQAVRELREAAMSEGGADCAETVAHMDDFTLARFLIARENKHADALSMLRQTMAWRKEAFGRGVNAIRAELHPASERKEGNASSVRYAASRAHFFAGWGGCCKDGSPFFVEKLGRFDVSSVNKDAAVYDLMMDSYVTYLETAFAMCRVASVRSGRMQRAHTIVDASDVSLSHATNVRVIKAVAKIGTSYYPEIMKKVWIVNVPWAFAAVWSLVSPMLPEHTRNKVAILGKNFLPQLALEIDESQLPPLLGGTSTRPASWLPGAEKVPNTLGDELRALAGKGEAAVEVS